MRSKIIVKLLSIELDWCYKNLDKAIKKLNGLPDGSLRETTINKHKRFYHCTTDSKGKYIKSGETSLVSALATKEFCLVVIKACNARINAIEKLLSLYDNWDWDNLQKELHPGKREYVDLDIITEKRMSETWLNKKYNKLTSFDNNYMTKKGELVKSKTEVIIADILFDYNIPYIYEKELILKDGTKFYPDFTIYDAKNNRIIIFEHFGYVNDPDYAKKTKEKISAYVRNGFVPFDTFIYTFEDSNIIFQVEAITSYVKNVLCK